MNALCVWAGIILSVVSVGLSGLLGKVSDTGTIGLGIGVLCVMSGMVFGAGCIYKPKV